MFVSRSISRLKRSIKIETNIDTKDVSKKCLSLRKQNENELKNKIYENYNDEDCGWC